MLVEKNVPLEPCNTFHIVARAHALVRVGSEADVLAVLADPDWGKAPKFILGGGSNIVLTGDVKALVLKVDIKGRRLLRETPRAWVACFSAMIDLNRQAVRGHSAKSAL